MKYLAFLRPNDAGKMTMRILTRLSLWVLLLFVISTACTSQSPTVSHRTPVNPQGLKLPTPVSCVTCWHPALKTSWQWQLKDNQGIDQSLNVAIYDIDMFDTSQTVVQSLHQAGRKVVCYVDAGTWENWRPDNSHFPTSIKGKGVSGWPGEQWLDIRNLKILGPLMRTRMDQCKAKGFDGIEFDNVDGYTNDTGFPLTAYDQMAYNILLANEAHMRGLSVALKNDLDQVADLLPYFDWALDEQCFEYDECNKLAPFTQANKAVMEVEYNRALPTFCPNADRLHFNSMKKHLSLDAYREPCS